MDALRPRRIEIRLHDHPDVLAVVDEEQMLGLADVRKADIVRAGRAVTLHLREVEGHVGHAPGVPPTLD